MNDLWSSDDPAAWRAALERYVATIAAQGVARLPDHDRWYRDELPASILARQPAYVTHEELVRTTEWKMARGVWRQRNLVLVRSNEPATVESTSGEALKRIPELAAPVTILARLAGVGPATASAVLSAVAPETYPFFDEIVANQIPDLGKVDFTARYYARYAAALRYQSKRLGEDWTPTMVERALWANAGGKAGLRR